MVFLGSSYGVLGGFQGVAKVFQSAFIISLCGFHIYNIAIGSY